MGAQFQVNTYTTGGQDNASVAIDADGDFVVVWENDDGVGPDTYGSIQGQRYSSSGSPVGPSSRSIPTRRGRQEKPTVAIDADGDFVVVWEGSYGYSLQAQRFDSSGSTVGPEFQVNTYTSAYAYAPSVAAAANGDFVVVWEGDESIQGRRFDSSGSGVGLEFQVSTYTASIPVTKVHP